MKLTSVVILMAACLSHQLYASPFDLMNDGFKTLQSTLNNKEKRNEAERQRQHEFELQARQQQYERQRQQATPTSYSSPSSSNKGSKYICSGQGMKSYEMADGSIVCY